MRRAGPRGAGLELLGSPKEVPGRVGLAVHRSNADTYQEMAQPHLGQGTF